MIKNPRAKLDDVVVVDDGEDGAFQAIVTKAVYDKGQWFYTLAGHGGTFKENLIVAIFSSSRQYYKEFNA